MRASVREQDQRIKRLVGLYVSREVSRYHFQSLKADYEEVKLSKLEALKALEEDAKDQQVVLDEALVILGDLPAQWTSLDDDGKQAWEQVLFQKLVINDRGKVVDRVPNHPFDEILEFNKGRSNGVRLSSPWRTLIEQRNSSARLRRGSECRPAAQGKRSRMPPLT